MLKSVGVSLAVLMSALGSQASFAASQPTKRALTIWSTDRPDNVQQPVKKLSFLTVDDSPANTYRENAQEIYQLQASVDTKQEAQKVEADQLSNEAFKLWRAGRWQDALKKLEQALILYREIGDRYGEVQALTGFGSIYRTLGEHFQALDYYEQALVISRAIGDRAGEGGALSDIGFTYDTLGNYAQALDYYEQALVISREIRDRAEEGRTLNNIGFTYVTLGDISEALDYYEQALPIIREIGDRMGESIALNNIGTAYRILGEYSQALQYYEQALPIIREIGDRKAESITLNDIGLTYNELGEYVQALQYYEQALPIIREIGDRTGEGVALTNIGLVYRYLDQYPKALGYFAQALMISREVGDRSNEANTLSNIGKTYLNLGQSSQALEHFEPTLVIRREIDDRAGIGDTLNNIGEVYRNLGQYPQALNYYEQALVVLRESGDRIDEGRNLVNIGATYGNLGQYPQALDYYEQALIILRESGDRAGEGITLSNIGGVYLTLGQYPQALNYYEQALPIVHGSGDRVARGRILINIGEVYRTSGQYPQSLGYQLQALTISRELGDRAGEGIALNNIGEVYRNLGQYPQALNYFEQALVISREFGDRAGEGRLLSNIGSVLFKTDQLAAAEVHFTQALSVLELIRDKDLSDENKVALFETQAQTYRSLQQVLIAQDKEAAAIEISEQGRARAFIELLEARLWGQANTISNDELPDFSDLKTIAQRQQATLVEYSIIDTRVGNSALYIWVISSDGTLNFLQVDLTNISLSDLVASSRNAIGARSRATIAAVPTAAARQQQQADLKQLHQLLIDPIADLLPTDPNQPVVFIPQDELFLVPFPALLDENDQHLIEKHTILTAPSIQVLDLTQKQQSQLGPLDLATLNSSDALLVGNPTMPEVYNPTSDSLEQLNPLSGAGKEVTAIGDELDITPLIGDAATEATVKAQIENARLIHLATHGLLDYGDPKETGVDDIPGAIALAPTSTEDGLLTTAELLDMDLTADLVVLSACDTGRGTITGDGVIGLSRGLITAGVPSVIVSLWKVPDDSTALLMTEFYKNWQTSGNKAQALREAMLTTMEKYPDPVYWSAFTLIGEAK